MLSDVVAEVIANTRLSSDYNVLALAAPAAARTALPGQFVMVKAAGRRDPLLRRPFSIFEIVRDGGGGVLGLSLLNKRIGIATSLFYDAAPGDRIQVLGPLGRPFVPVPRPPKRGWSPAASGSRRS